MPQKVVSIYNDSTDTGNCWTGLIHEVDEDYVLIAHFTEHGFYDGFVLHAVDGIFNIEQGTSYEKKVQKLYKLRKQSHPSLQLDKKLSLLEALLVYAKNEATFISITLRENDEYPPTGLIEELTEGFVCLKSFTSRGIEDGFSYIKKEDIHQLFLDSLSEQDLSLIYSNSNK